MYVLLYIYCGRLSSVKNDAQAFNPPEDPCNQKLTGSVSTQARQQRRSAGFRSTRSTRFAWFVTRGFPYRPRSSTWAAVRPRWSMTCWQMRTRITVLDLSAAALAAARARLGVPGNAVHWLEADITQIDLPVAHFDVWHDRAVFHFLDLGRREAGVCSGRASFGQAGRPRHRRHLCRGRPDPVQRPAGHALQPRRTARRVWHAIRAAAAREGSAPHAVWHRAAVRLLLLSPVIFMTGSPAFTRPCASRRTAASPLR